MSLIDGESSSGDLRGTAASFSLISSLEFKLVHTLPAAAAAAAAVYVVLLGFVFLCIVFLYFFGSLTALSQKSQEGISATDCEADRGIRRECGRGTNDCTTLS